MALGLVFSHMHSYALLFMWILSTVHMIITSQSLCKHWKPNADGWSSSSLRQCDYTTNGLNNLLWRHMFFQPVWAGNRKIFSWAPERGCDQRGEKCVHWPEVGRQGWKKGRSEMKGGRWSGSPGCGRGCSPEQASFAPWPRTSAGTHPGQQYTQKQLIYWTFEDFQTEPTNHLHYIKHFGAFQMLKSIYFS